MPVSSRVQFNAEESQHSKHSPPADDRPKHKAGISLSTGRYLSALTDRTAAATAWEPSPYGTPSPYATPNGYFLQPQVPNSSSRSSPSQGARIRSGAAPQLTAARVEPDQSRRTFTLDMSDGIAGAGAGVGVNGSGRAGAGGYDYGSVGALPAPATGPGRTWGTPSGTSRTHYHLSRQEVLKGVANRFVHSTAYLYFYGGMAAVSLLTVVLSLWQDCPGPLFYGLELAINAVLIAEVTIRGYAFGRQFWKSTFNIVDLCLVILCAVTLAVIFFSHDCSPYRRGTGDAPSPGDDLPGHGGRGGRGEELLDSILLIVRNGVQLFRLLAVVRRSGSNVTSRVANIDLNAARDFSLDIDLEDEGAAARERMADGGDPGARRARMDRRGDRPEEQGLFDEDDEDEI